MCRILLKFKVYYKYAIECSLVDIIWILYIVGIYKICKLKSLQDAATSNLITRIGFFERKFLSQSMMEIAKLFRSTIDWHWFIIQCIRQCSN